LEIRGNSDAPDQSEDDALLFSLGGNVPLVLSSVVQVDGFVQDMPEGFPRLESSESQGYVFVFRFPIFSDFIEYDPIVPYSSSIPVLTDEPVVDTAITPTSNPTNTTTIAPVGSPTASREAPTPSPVVNIPEEKKVEDDGGLSVGAIVGIVVGLLGLGGICGFVGFVVLRRKGDSESGTDGKGLITVDGDENFDDEQGRGRYKDDVDDDNSNNNGDDDDDDNDDARSDSDEEDASVG
jgi:hypothetical protein